MAGKEVSKSIIGNLRELETRLTLRRVRAKGHIYVELRKDGKDEKRLIYYCVLCRSPCYGDSSLFDHLKGKFHRGRCKGAELTLFGPNPWPFNDGLFFFYDSSDHDVSVYGPTNPDNLLNFNVNGSDHGESSRNDVNSLIKFEKICDNKSVEYGKGVLIADESLNVEGRNSDPDTNCLVNFNNNDNHGGSSRNGVNSLVRIETVSNNKNVESENGVLLSHDESSDLVLPGVLWKEQKTNLKVRLVGLGKIGAKIDDVYGIADEMIAIWCEWLGKKDPKDEEVSMVPYHDFGIVIFPCNVDLGRYAPGLSPSPPNGLSSEDEEDGSKDLKSFSDPEDISSTLSRRGGSYGASSVQDQCDLQIQNTRSEPKKVSKRKLRKQKRLQRLAEQRVCEMCQHRLLQGKDVACLLNMKTGRLACSGSNKTGAFHIFHTSCLLHWILVCESEIWKNQLPRSEMKRQPVRIGTKRKSNKLDDEKTKLKQQISTVFCPQCNCTGINTEEDKPELRQLIGPSQLFEHKITTITKHKEWMQKPEVLPNRSTGLRFISNAEEPFQEKVSLQKLVRFYRVDDENSTVEECETRTDLLSSIS